MGELSMFELSGFGGLIVLVLDVWALLSITGSSEPTGRKVIWALLVILLPIVGFVVWLLAGPRGQTGRI